MAVTEIKWEVLKSEVVKSTAFNTETPMPVLAFPCLGRVISGVSRAFSKPQFPAIRGPCLLESS